MTESGLTAGTLLRQSMGLASIGAGVIHLSVAGDHRDHLAMVAFFVAVGSAQVAWGLAVIVAPSRWLLVLGAAGSLGVAAVWVASRTSGIPFVGGAQDAEPVGVADLAATVLELGVLGGIAVLGVLPLTAQATRLTPSVATRALAVSAAAVLGLVVPATVVPHGHARHDHVGEDAAHAHGGGEAATAAHDGHAEDGHADDDHAHDAASVAATGAGHDEHAHDGGAASSSSAMAAHDHGDGTAADGTNGHGADGHDPGAHGAGDVGTAAHDHGAACSPSPDEQAAADALVEATRTALVTYNDHTTAMADGYVAFPPTPTNWTQHYVDFAALDDEYILDPEHPESLLYAMTDDGYRPISALFIMPHAGMTGPDVGGCLTDWHAHPELFLSRPGEEESPEMLHVFVVPMAGGAFAHDADPRSVRELWGPFRTFVNPWWQDSCYGLPLVPGDPFAAVCADEPH